VLCPLGFFQKVAYGSFLDYQIEALESLTLIFLLEWKTHPNHLALVICRVDIVFPKSIEVITARLIFVLHQTLVPKTVGLVLTAWQ
jgi:hypothetical protein